MTELGDEIHRAFVAGFLIGGAFALLLGLAIGLVLAVALLC